MIFLKILGMIHMEGKIEIDGNLYTEAEIKRALDLEKEILSPNFIKDLAEMFRKRRIEDEGSLRGEVLG
jgi:hypothetical protein